MNDFFCPYCSSKVDGITRHHDVQPILTLGSAKRILQGPDRIELEPCGCNVSPEEGQAFMDWAHDQMSPEPSAAELEAVKRSLVKMYREDTAVEKEKPKTLRDVLRQKWLASQRFPTTSMGPK